MEQRLSAITLGVADLDRAVAFYRDGLGLTAGMEVPGEVAFFQMNGLVLCLYGDLAKDSGLEGETFGRGLVSVGHNVREKEGVDALLAQVQAAGATITNPARDTDWGGRSGYFADPDGHLWEVAWNPFWPISPEGATTLT